MKTQSIRTKIFAVTCAATLILVSALVAYFAHAHSAALQESLDEEALGYTSLLSRALAPTLGFDDQETPREMFDATMQGDDVTSLALYGADNRLIYMAGEATDPPPDWVDTTRISHPTDRVRVVAPVVSPEGRRGALVVELNTQELRFQRAQSLRAASVAGVGALVLGFAFAWILGSSLGSRLRAIANATKAVASGDLNQPDLRDSSVDEIGRVASGFNTMAGNIRAMVDQIKTTAATENERLDALVQQRTSQLDARNRDMRLVLDNVGQGFFTIDARGVVSEERSAITEVWLGPLPPSGTLQAWIACADKKVGEWMEIGIDALAAAFLPIEVLLDQMPKRLEHDGRILSLSYEPISVGATDRFLVVISDITSLEAQARAEETQREFLAFVERFVRDRDGVVEFVSEATALVERVVIPEVELSAETRRMLHTLKGNAAMFGLKSIAGACDAIETEIADCPLPLNDGQRDRLRTAWAVFRRRAAVLLDGERNRLQIEDTQYDSLLRKMTEGAPHADLVRELTGWKLEPAHRTLHRLGDQARALALRLGKPDLHVVIEHDEDLRFSLEKWSPFWAAMTHVVRNAIDHGIELPDTREAGGKSREGTLVLRARRRHGQIVVEVRDDGRGIDREALRARAVAMGMTDVGLDLVFCDGLTTKDEITQLSGRGVGLNAVRAACHALGGESFVESTLGEGCTFRFVIPEKSSEVRTRSRGSISALAAQ